MHQSGSSIVQPGNVAIETHYAARNAHFDVWRSILLSEADENETDCDTQ